MLFTKRKLFIAISTISIIFLSAYLFVLMSSNIKDPCGTPTNKNCTWSTEEAMLTIPHGASKPEVATMVVALFDKLKEQAMKNCEKYGMIATLENTEKPGTMFSYMKKNGEIIWVDPTKPPTDDTALYFFTPMEYTELGKLWKKKKFKRRNKIYVNYKCTTP